MAPPGTTVCTDQPLQAYRLAHAFHHSVRDRVCTSGALCEDALDVILVPQDFITPFPHWRKKIPQFFEKLFFEIPVAACRLF